MVGLCNRGTYNTLKFIVLITVCVLVGISCNLTDKRELLKRSSAGREESIEYEGSKKYGNYINAVEGINGIKTHYSFKVSDDGELLHVLKYHNQQQQKSETDLDYYRDMQLLVTDTSRVNGPNFFGQSINGYYTDTFLVNNVILDKQSKTSLTPLLPEEKKLFVLIDSLAKSNNIKYNDLDTSKVLGWFKYLF